MGAKTSPLFPIDTCDANQVARFTLGLGYAPAQVLTTLIRRCNVDKSTAQRIIRSVQQSQEVQ